MPATPEPSLSQCALARVQKDEDARIVKGSKPKRGRLKRRRGILTAIDQAVVVLLVRLAPVPAARKPHKRNALAASLCVVVEVDFLAWSNGLVEELL